MSDRSASPVSVTRLRCEECRATSDAEARGWRALLGYDPREDEHPVVGIYCPECAQREFGPDACA